MVSTSTSETQLLLTFHRYDTLCKINLHVMYFIVVLVWEWHPLSNSLLSLHWKAVRLVLCNSIIEYCTAVCLMYIRARYARCVCNYRLWYLIISTGMQFCIQKHSARTLSEFLSLWCKIIFICCLVHASYSACVISNIAIGNCIHSKLLLLSFVERLYYC